MTSDAVDDPSRDGENTYGTHSNHKNNDIRWISMFKRLDSPSKSLCFYPFFFPKINVFVDILTFSVCNVCLHRTTGHVPPSLPPGTGSGSSLRAVAGSQLCCALDNDDDDDDDDDDGDDDDGPPPRLPRGRVWACYRYDDVVTMVM